MVMEVIKELDLYRSNIRDQSLEFEKFQDI